MAGLLDARVKAELGPSLDGIVAVQNFVPAPTLSFPGLGALISGIEPRPARNPTRLATATCRSAMPPARCWRRR